MLGGYQILNLGSIDLSRATSESSITDVEVLKQLSHIADHIQKTYDFSKPLENQLKPVLIRYRDKKVGEKHEVALFGNIEVINSYYKFRIVANNEGEQLTINVEFEEKTDEYSNKYWAIKTAKILLTSAQPIFEEITDKEGHKRFIEGDIVCELEGITLTYGKWSLSGSHLMIVIAGTYEAGTDIANYAIFGVLQDLPKWIYDKIYPQQSDVVDIKGFSTINTDWTSDTINTLLVKDNNLIQVQNYGANSLVKSGLFRISFDLLIDNESQE